MKIVIDIPEEFEEHFNKDRFSDSLARVASDIESFGFQLAGRYEQETITMIRKAFEQATPLEAQPTDAKTYLKRREKDYVSYNIEWLLKHWEQELDLLSGGKIKACEDAVSREALINKATSWNTHFTDSERYVSLSDIEALPSVTPQRPKGKWIEKTVNDSEDEGQEAIEVWQSAKCNKCKKYHTTPYMYYFDNFNYCPNCGCYMGGDADDNS